MNIKNPFRVLPKKAQQEYNKISAIKVKGKVRCVITDILPSGERIKLAVKRLKLSDLNEKGFFSVKGLGSYHFDSNKIFLLGNEIELLYQKGITEPLEYKNGVIEGHSSYKTDDMMNHRFIQQLIAGISKTQGQDIMMYVMMAIIGVAGFAIGYIFGNPALMHTSTSTAPKVSGG